MSVFYCVRNNDLAVGDRYGYTLWWTCFSYSGVEATVSILRDDDWVYIGEL
jgi:hypothetical protein